MIRIGVDVGGTFTDITALDTGTGARDVYKLPSTPGDQSEAVAEGIDRLVTAMDATAASIGYLGHGTTVATNALLERAGARTALITTRGFRDVLEIARQRRPALYDLFVTKPAPLTRRAWCFEVDERLSAAGKVLVELDTARLDPIIARLRELEIQAVAVCLLHSYRDPVHEIQIRDHLRRHWPEGYVSISSEITPEFREYERFTTTTMNSYVGPPMARYLDRLGRRVAELGSPVAPLVIQSNGGLASLAATRDRPVGTLLSGPSAGVVAARHLGERIGRTNLITFDMGGTSTDVCLIGEGTAMVSPQRDVDGYPVRSPSLDIHTIGAGGGSIAAVDPGGALTVGPRSAGARPGPACYGHGGDRPTVTDAHAVLGRLSPEGILGGAMRLDVAAAEAVVDGLAGELGMDRERTALGILRLVEAGMARAIRHVSVATGVDPRDHVLVAFGGAGPLHAAGIAAELGIGTVLVPPNPGTLCALGLLVTDLRTDLVGSVYQVADTEALPELNGTLRRLSAQARSWLAAEHIDPADRELTAVASMRYRRQNYELDVPLPARDLTTGDLTELVERFHALHTEAYGFAHEGAPVQIVGVRVSAVGRIPRHEPPPLPSGGPTPPPSAVAARRPVVFEAGTEDATIYRRDALLAGNRIAGPAIVEQLDTTTVLPPGTTGRIDEHGNLLIEVATR
ncbi:hydantoinase/oxoprolinase family protein [Actinoallomurus sp. NBC_01490]|uniref:hydantoinase/oxoprolinase family protein n=1 Tax=Actinoallomurus sp. NBC_01490 TaxID=2903557 RepID=UPI002E36B01F|nr:hydantoinase/oxoprolinase family protein [Actinoallomurus sp. NBC_01490]